MSDPEGFETPVSEPVSEGVEDSPESKEHFTAEAMHVAEEIYTAQKEELLDKAVIFKAVASLGKGLYATGGLLAIGAVLSRCVGLMEPNSAHDLFRLGVGVAGAGNAPFLLGWAFSNLYLGKLELLREKFHAQKSPDSGKTATA